MEQTKEERFISKANIRINDAKERSRPELGIDKLWSKMDIHTHFCEYFICDDTIERIAIQNVTKAFYQNLNYPVVVLGMQDEWRAKYEWTFDKFNSKYRNCSFICGEDEHGYPVKLKMKYFIYYVKTNTDDSPLYIFDYTFGGERSMKKLQKDYDVPIYFRDDLFQFCGESQRPLYRWFLMGSARTGSGIHIDPLGTSSWTALIKGFKRWCIFPNDTPKELLQVSPSDGGKGFREASTWFKLIYPKTKLKSWPLKFKPIEIFQRPGETVFVPSGWWNVFLNLSATIAVTQNFCNRTNFQLIWKETKCKEPLLAAEWLKGLKVFEPELATIAENIDINVPSSFVSDSPCSSIDTTTLSGPLLYKGESYSDSNEEDYDADEEDSS